MGLINLKVYPRSTTGKNANRRSRVAGRIPAVLYGNDVENQIIELDKADFMKTLGKISGSSAIFALTQEGVEDGAIALLKEIQANPVTDEVLHVDLFGIPRGVPVTVPVTLHIVGTNNAVKMGEGSVALSMTSVEVSCRPRDLPDFIEVDITELELNDKIFVRDIVSPVGEIVTDPEALVLNIKPPVMLAPEEEEEDGEEGTEEGAAAETEESKED